MPGEEILPCDEDSDQLARWERPLKRSGDRAAISFPIICDQTQGGVSMGLPPIVVNSMDHLRIIGKANADLNRGATASCRIGFTQLPPG